ncbi:MAG: radical SAM/SPASM domain-containing protein [Bacteroidota bacterium]
MNLRTFFHLLSFLTFRRFINAVKIYFSFIFSYITKTSTCYGMPVAISVEPTTSCNLHCAECMTGQDLISRPKGEMKLELFQKIIDDVHNNIIYLSLYFQGEPLLCNNLFEMIIYAKRKNIFTEISTNANIIDDYTADKIVRSKLDSIIISIDGTSEDAYTAYRKGGSLSKVLEGITNINNSKKELKSKTPFITLQFLVTQKNEHQIDEIKRLSKKLNADKLTIKTMQIINTKNAENTLPSSVQYRRYNKDEVGNFVLSKQKGNHCFRMWSRCVITWDGKVLPCCFDKNANYFFGNITDIDFNTIWKSTEYNNFRKQILADRKKINICNDCSE